MWRRYAAMLHKKELQTVKAPNNISSTNQLLQKITDSPKAESSPPNHSL